MLADTIFVCMQKCHTVSRISFSLKIAWSLLLEGRISDSVQCDCSCKPLISFTRLSMSMARLIQLASSTANEPPPQREGQMLID